MRSVTIFVVFVVAIGHVLVDPGFARHHRNYMDPGYFVNLSESKLLEHIEGGCIVRDHGCDCVVAAFGQLFGHGFHEGRTESFALKFIGDVQ